MRTTEIASAVCVLASAALDGAAEKLHHLSDRLYLRGRRCCICEQPATRRMDHGDAICDACWRPIP